MAPFRSTFTVTFLCLSTMFGFNRTALAEYFDNTSQSSTDESRPDHRDTEENPVELVLLSNLPQTEFQYETSESDGGDSSSKMATANPLDVTSMISSSEADSDAGMSVEGSSDHRRRAALSLDAAAEATSDVGQAKSAQQTSQEIAETNAKPFSILNPAPADIPVDCVGQWTERLITDGLCISFDPVAQVKCSGHCLPMQHLPWYAEFISVWPRSKLLDWNCVDFFSSEPVMLDCLDGTTTMRIVKLSTGCSCRLTRSRRRHENRRKYVGLSPPRIRQSVESTTTPRE